MFSTSKTRKRAFHPLTMALTVVILLALLVPVASAAPVAQDAPGAPEWVHGISITYPTTATPAYVDPAHPYVPPAPPVEKEGDNIFWPKFDLTIVGTQVDDVEIRIRAIDPNGSIVVWEFQYIVATNALVPGVNSLKTPTWVTPAFDPGWYTFEICARDMDPGRDWFCDREQYAVLIDLDNPGVRLIKPAEDAWITGMNYLLVGKAWDPWWAEDDLLLQYGGIAQTWFDYCVLSNFQGGFCGPSDQSWIRIAMGTPTPGVPWQYEARWDSTQVPDDESVMRFCAVDLVGRGACDVHFVHVENRYTVALHPGWNLISTPLMLYNDDMATVLFHLKDPFTQASLVDKVYFDYPTWKLWTPANTPPAQFMHGQGYWIYMKAPAELTFVGTWKNVGNQAPPEYAVFEGWNLIGYTHWGEPTDPAWYGDKTVFDYLEGPVAASMQALWLYDAWSETYIPLYSADSMVKGAGYWLAVSQDGVIRP